MTGAARVAEGGVGIAARAAHFETLLHTQSGLDFIELLTDNHLAAGGPARWTARALARRFPVALHGVGLSLGSIDPLDRAYLRRVRVLAQELDARWVSDHIAFTRVDGIEYHDLLPLPGTRAALAHLIDRVSEAQERLGRPLLLENPSRYLADAADALPEPTFLSELCRRTGCGLLLDLNNLHVSAHNLGGDARDVVEALNPALIGYVHIAGHERRDGLLIDTHGAAITDPVWDLLTVLVRRRPDLTILIERDHNLPPLEELLAEAQHA